MASLSGTLATMGPGVPYAIAAKFAYPDRPVIALVGDGAMQMNGINELITIAKYRDRWADQRLIVLVLNNRDLNQVTWEQRAMEGDPKFEGSQDLPDFPYARYARDDRAEGHPRRRARAGRPAHGTRRWPRTGRSCSRRSPIRRCRRCRRTSRIEQAKALTSALLAGDPDAERHHQAVVQAEGRGVPARPMTSTATAARAEIPVDELEVGAYTIPTDAPEADGTLAWDATTIVVVHAHGGGERGLGYTYADVATAKLIDSKLAGVVHGRDAMAPPAAWAAMVARPATSGGRGSPRWRSPPSTSRCGISRRGCSGCRCASCSGCVRDRVPVYGQRRLHAPTRTTGSPRSWAAGSSRDPARQDEGRLRAGAGSRARAGRARRRSARTPSCSSTPTAPTRASRRSSSLGGSRTRRA